MSIAKNSKKTKQKISGKAVDELSDDQSDESISGGENEITAESFQIKEQMNSESSEKDNNCTNKSSHVNNSDLLPKGQLKTKSLLTHSVPEKVSLENSEESNSIPISRPIPELKVKKISPRKVLIDGLVHHYIEDDSERISSKVSINNMNTSLNIDYQISKSNEATVSVDENQFEDSLTLATVDIQPSVSSSHSITINDTICMHYDDDEPMYSSVIPVNSLTSTSKEDENILSTTIISEINVPKDIETKLIIHDDDDVNNNNNNNNDNNSNKIQSFFDTVSNFSVGIINTQEISIQDLSRQSLDSNSNLSIEFHEDDINCKEILDKSKTFSIPEKNVSNIFSKLIDCSKLIRLNHDTGLYFYILIFLLLISHFFFECFKYVEVKTMGYVHSNFGVDVIPGLSCWKLAYDNVSLQLLLLLLYYYYYYYY